MDRFVYNDDFNKDVIYNRIAELSSKLEEEMGKDEPDTERERELLYAQMIAGLKLNTMFPNKYFTF